MNAAKTTPRVLRSAFPACVAAWALMAGCDPGWSYVVPSGRPVMADGLRYDLAGPSQTALRVYTSLFTSDLTVELEITNTGVSPLVVPPRPLLSVLGREGIRLPRRDRDGTSTCLGRASPTGPVALPSGQSCRIGTHFVVKPDPKELRTLTVTVGGFTRDGQPVTISIPLEKG